MEQMEHLEHSGTMTGVILEPSQNRVKRANPSRNWCFTWNNYDDGTLEHLEHRLLEEAEKFVMGKEVGESGTPHIQGWIKFKVRKRPIEWAKIPGIHWERQRGSDWQAYSYCTKDGNYIDHNCEDLGKQGLEKVKDPLEGREYYEWQDEVMSLLEEEPDDRTIHWYWEPTGRAGKTSLAKHICLKYSKHAVYCNGKSADIKCMIAKRRDVGMDTKIVIFGFPRSKENYVSYEAMEDVKDGIFFNGKYESSMVVMNNPHVLVFANFEPDYNALSGDRWVVTKIPLEVTEMVDPDTYESKRSIRA